MTRASLTFKALGERLARPGRAWQNRVWASRARRGARPRVAEDLPEPVLYGDADRGRALVEGRWQACGHEIVLGRRTLWDVALPDLRLEVERQACLWLDDLAAAGDRTAREHAQTLVQDWIRRFGRGRGQGWQPELAGRRAKRWTAHAQLLTRGRDDAASDRFWQALAAHQRYLLKAWPRAEPGLGQLRALGGLVWSGVVLPHTGHAEAVAALGQVAAATIDAEGGVPSRAPEELAEALILLIWSARVLEDAGQHAATAHLSAIARAVPVLRPLRMGDGTLARFHGGGAGNPDEINQALAELRLGVQAKPDLPMGYARLTGSRVVVVMDAAKPPPGTPQSAHAGTLGFEMSVGRQPFIVNAGPGHVFGRDHALAARQSEAHSTVEIGGRSSARIERASFAARTFGPALEAGPSLVSVRQAQDATGMWLMATHDGYVQATGLLHERRIFVDARGQEVRGEEILTVTDARAQAQFDVSAIAGRMPFTARFHIHPDVAVERDPAGRYVTFVLPAGDAWMFRAGGGLISLEQAAYYEPDAAEPLDGWQVVVRTEVVGYLGSATWSFARIPDAPDRGPPDHQPGT